MSYDSVLHLIELLEGYCGVYNITFCHFRSLETFETIFQFSKNGKGFRYNVEEKDVNNTADAICFYYDVTGKIENDCFTNK